MSRCGWPYNLTQEDAGANSGGAGPPGWTLCDAADWSPWVTAAHFFTIRVRKNRLVVLPE